jgi:phosphomevalonate kinase
MNQTTTKNNNKAFSSTGKAILAGGYLVLFPEYKAYVVALSARMHAVANVTNTTTLHEGCFNITVNSPQFKNGSWSYDFSIIDILRDELNYKFSEKNGKYNPFVEATILTVINYLIGKKFINNSSSGKNIIITMFSDSEYHSQDGSISKSSTNNAFKFLYHQQEITKVNKTGLGSSAGLVTSLTAALMSIFIENFDIESNDLKWKEKVHNLAQIAHCKAQGKIGSGFDVASATFGSIIYQRFTAKLVTDILESTNNTIIKLVYLVDEQDWNMVHDVVKMPPGIKLLMGDVKGGSETPKMVSKVLEWKNSNFQHCQQIWTELNNNNMKLIESMQRMNELSNNNSQSYAELLELLDKQKTEDFLNNDSKSHLRPLQDIINAIKNIRKCLKIMTVETGASIEPDSQTQLLNNVSSIVGVLGGVVPGAGGYDAICLLVASSRAQTVIDTTSNSAKYSHVRWMDLSEQNKGLIEESPSDFDGLV